MSESKLLQEAIADAKAVKQTALENAKIALEEAFTPKLQSMLSNKIQSELEEVKAVNEEDDEDDDKDKDKKDDDYEDDDMDESKDKIKENDDDDEDDKDDDYKDDDEDDDMDENSDKEDVDLDLEAVIKELEEDLQETADIDQDPDDDDDANEEETITKKQKPVNKESKDENIELDLDSILEEIELEEDINENGDVDQVLESKTQIAELNTTVSDQAVMLEDYKKAVIFLKEKINEINLLNAKLLYANKLFRTYEMTNEDKVKVIEAIDRSTSTREVKLVYSTLAESMRMANVAKPRTEAITEGASATQTSTKPTQTEQPNTSLITEAVDPARWKTLAGLE